MTIADPFADAPAEEAPVAEAPKTAAPAVAQTGEGKIVMTFKEGAGFDTTWNVVHANNVDEALSLLSDEKFKELLDRQKKVASYFRGGSSAVPAAPAANGRPAGATEAPSWAPPKPYDDFVYKTGFSQKTGKTWHAWMPPQKGDNRPAKFFNEN